MNYVLYENEIFTYQQFCEKIGVNLSTFQKFIYRKKGKEFEYQNYKFRIVKLYKIPTLINKCFRAPLKDLFFKNKKLDKVVLINYFDNLAKEHPYWKDYQDFYDLLKQKIHNKNFQFVNFAKRFKAKTELWICDTETYYEKVFYDPNKKMETDKDILENLDVEKTRELYKNNKNLKPYMWAWNALRFNSDSELLNPYNDYFLENSDDYVLFNYYDAVEYLDSLTQKVKQYYHNLTYDAKYVADALVTEKGYSLVRKTIKNYEDLDEEAKEKLKRKKKQPRKSIYIFASDTKVFYASIRNSKGHSITMECSWLKLMASVRSMGEKIQTPKLEINYLQKREKNHIFSITEKKYIFSDVYIVKEFFKMINQKFQERFKRILNWKLTIGMTAMNILKTQVASYKTEFQDYFVKDKEGNFYINAEEDQYNILSYNGGWSNYSLKFLGKVLAWVASVDIRSSYPAIMKYMKLPYGKIIYDCLCDDNLTNNSKHFKLYELKVLEDIPIDEGKENMLPVRFEEEQDGKKVRLTEYFPFLLKGKTYYVTQYMLKIVKVLFSKNEDKLIYKKTRCFEHKVIPIFHNFVCLWENEKSVKGLKEENPAYYDFTKFQINSPGGKMGQKTHLDEIEYIVEDGIITKNVVKDAKKLEDIQFFSYKPLIAAITDMARLRLLSLIEEIGWEYWVISDTDSCKFAILDDLIKDKLDKSKNPTYLNLIVDERETIYGDDFGKWDFEYLATKFKSAGKKKYIYKCLIKDKELSEITGNNEWKEYTKVVCAGATKDIKAKMSFENFFFGYSSLPNEKTNQSNLNGLPVILPTTFKMKNVFSSKIIVLLMNKHLLNKEYLNNVIELKNKVNKIKSEIDKIELKSIACSKNEFILQENNIYE